MKTTITLGAVLLLAACSSAQKTSEKEIPATVKTAFESQFPNAQKTTWEKEDAGYEAEFKLNNEEYSATFDAAGNLQETEMEIQPQNLPQGARTYVEEHYKGQKIKEAAKLVAADGTITFEAEVNGKDVIFDANGSFLKELKD